MRRVCGSATHAVCVCRADVLRLNIRNRVRTCGTHPALVGRALMPDVFLMRRCLPVGHECPTYGFRVFRRPLRPARPCGTLPARPGCFRKTASPLRPASLRRLRGGRAANSLGSVDIRSCGGVFGKNPRLPRQKCPQVSNLAALFSLHTRIFPQKTASQAECQQTPKTCRPRLRVRRVRRIRGRRLRCTRGWFR